MVPIISKCASSSVLVSYTHLDVYKRQGQGKAPDAAVVESVREAVQKEAPVGVTVAVQAVALKKIPVSAELTAYPDVYKRQR